MKCDCNIKNCDKFQCIDKSKNAEWAYTRKEAIEDYLKTFGCNAVANKGNLGKTAVRFSNKKMDSVSREARMR